MKPARPVRVRTPATRTPVDEITGGGLPRCRTTLHAGLPFSRPVPAADFEAKFLAPPAGATGECL